MNLYFVLEGEKTEVLLYPKWISHIIPELVKVDFESEVINNNYYIFSGGGIPSIYRHVVNAIKNINDNPVFDKLIVCLDGEEEGVVFRLQEIQHYILDSEVVLRNSCSIDFVIQNICIETWFLGNRKIIKRTPEGEKLREFIKHYNVIINDPELMDKIEPYRTKAHFHYSYFREVLKEHKLSYSKSNPKVVLEQTYLEELLNRVTHTEHLPSLKHFIDLLFEIRDQITNQ